MWWMFRLVEGLVDMFSGLGIMVGVFSVGLVVGVGEGGCLGGKSGIVGGWFGGEERGRGVWIFKWGE